MAGCVMAGAAVTSLYEQFRHEVSKVIKNKVSSLHIRTFRSLTANVPAAEVASIGRELPQAAKSSQEQPGSWQEASSTPSGEPQKAFL